MTAGVRWRAGWFEVTPGNHDTTVWEHPSGQCYKFTSPAPHVVSAVTAFDRQRDFAWMIDHMYPLQPAATPQPSTIQGTP
jgi:hypothetical protein